jgi:hypothetical protein
MEEFDNFINNENYEITDFKLKEEQINYLKNKINMIPEYNFILAIHYYNIKKFDQYLKYNKFLSDSGSKIGYNLYAYYLERNLELQDEAIEWYLKSIEETKNIFAMNNLADYYDKINFISQKNKYLTMAYNNKSGVACYKIAFSYLENDDMSNHYKYLKYGCTFGNFDCMSEILDYLKQTNYDDYLKYLNILAKTGNNIYIEQQDNELDKSKNLSDDKLNQALEYLNINNLDQVYKIANNMIIKNDINGFGLLYLYYEKHNNIDLGFTYLEKVKIFDDSSFINYCHGSYNIKLFYREEALKFFKKSYQILENIYNIKAIKETCFKLSYFEEFVKFMKIEIKTNINYNPKVDYLLIDERSDKDLNIELIKNGFVIGLILLSEFFDIKKICKNIKSIIVDSEIDNCQKCFELIYTRFHAHCGHQICLDCFKNIIISDKLRCVICNFDLLDISHFKK